MPGFLLHQGAVVMCAHAGQATSPSPFPRVLVMGMPVTVQPVPYVIAGCTQASIPAPFCATANWVVGALRVKAGGMIYRYPWSQLSDVWRTEQDVSLYIGQRPKQPCTDMSPPS